MVSKPKLDHVRALDANIRHKYTRDADGKTVTIYYSLQPKLDSVFAEEEGHHHLSSDVPWEAETISSLRTTMDWLEEHFHMRFIKVDDLDKLPADAPQPPNRWAIIAASDLSKNKNPESKDGTAAYANYPSKQVVRLVFGPTGGLSAVSHEMGHALGLKHPHSKKWRAGYVLDRAVDSRFHTTMSYDKESRHHMDVLRSHVEGWDLGIYLPFDYDALSALYQAKPRSKASGDFLLGEQKGNSLITQNYDALDARGVTHWGEVVLDLNPGPGRWIQGQHTHMLADGVHIPKAYGAPDATNTFIGSGGNISLPSGHLQGEKRENHFIGGGRQNDFFAGNGPTVVEGGPSVNRFYAGQGPATYIVHPEKPARGCLWDKRDEFLFNHESGDCIIRGLDTDNGHKVILGFSEGPLAAVRDVALHFEHEIPVLTFRGKEGDKACTIRFENFKGRISELYIEKCRPKDGMIQKYCRWKDMRICPRIVGEIPPQFQGEPRYTSPSDEYSLLEKTEPVPEAPPDKQIGSDAWKTLAVRLRETAHAIGQPREHNIYLRMYERLDLILNRSKFLATARGRGATGSEVKTLAAIYDYAWHHPMSPQDIEKARKHQHERAQTARDSR